MSFPILVEQSQSHPVDCGAPLFPPNSTNTTVSGTTVGAMATFQCEEGLIPSGPITSTCTDTETGGQWLPNPADTQCTDSLISTTTGGENIENYFSTKRVDSNVIQLFLRLLHSSPPLQST